MKRAGWLLLAALAAPVGAGGCAISYVLGYTGAAPPAPKPEGCAFDVLDGAPRRAFDEIAIIAPRDIEYGEMAGGSTPYREAVGALVCRAGGDAVVAERDWLGRYIRGTVIKYR